MPVLAARVRLHYGADLAARPWCEVGKMNCRNPPEHVPDAFVKALPGCSITELREAAAASDAGHRDHEVGGEAGHEADHQTPVQDMLGAHP